VSAAFVISQLLILSVDQIGHLWIASAALGGAYGAMFGLFPTVTIDWFGLCEFPFAFI
jgi:hypothetical protein